MQKIAWLEWGKESFDKARSSGKPILLDITGSWCHWCHVMDETSYADPSIISTINKSFVPIRVDTDQRPDINRRYNLGGWPTTAFLDANGKIITGGTYIPPEKLREVLRSVLDFYSTNKGKVSSKLQPSAPLEPTKEPLSEKITKDIATTIAVNFDIDYGGFGFEPKFPHAEALEYALMRYRYHAEKEMLTVVTKTLDKMTAGGVYDQVEQGFFRYSTTRDWSIPHFEKMAEDNAKLLKVLLQAFQLTGKTLYRQKAEGVIKYLETTLSDKELGGFYGSQDANEEYYALDMSERKKRKAPSVDKTFYTNYNAELVSSFLLASSVLDRPDIGKFALKTLDRILELGKPGILPFHYWKEAEGTVLKDLLIDYATLLHSTIDAYEYSGKNLYLQKAIELSERGIRTLNDNTLAGFYDVPATESDIGELQSRDKPIDENSLMAAGLLRASWLTGKDEYETIARTTLEMFNADYERYGLAAASYAHALDSYLNGPIGINIVASSKSKQLLDFKSKALNLYSGRRYVSYLDPTRDSERIRKLGYDSRSTPVAYVCVGKTCGPPLHDPSQIDTSVNSLLEIRPLAP